MFQQGYQLFLQLFSLIVKDSSYETISYLFIYRTYPKVLLTQYTSGIDSSILILDVFTGFTFTCDISESVTVRDALTSSCPSSFKLQASFKVVSMLTLPAFKFSTSESLQYFYSIESTCIGRACSAIVLVYSYIRQSLYSDSNSHPKCSKKSSTQPQSYLPIQNPSSGTGNMFFPPSSRKKVYFTFQFIDMFGCMNGS